MKKIGCGCFPLFLIFFMPILFFFGLAGSDQDLENNIGGATSVEAFDGEYSEGLPIFKEIKGTGAFSDEVVQLAVGSAVKYRLLPSVILSQWAYESAWGQSASARNDLNYFGITYFDGCPFPRGTSRGIGGSEGGNYMKFPNNMACFSYYGFMVASQSNFNACVGNTSPNECLLILGRGGYAAAGITINSPYYTACLSIIEKNNLKQYDDFAQSKWQTFQSSKLNQSSKGTKGSIQSLEKQLGKQVNNGECYGLTAYYVQQLGGPQMMGSGHMYAQDIGQDYDWGRYGFKVIHNPKPSDLKAGDVVNWYAGGVLSPGIYGHTGIISSVSNGGQKFSTYEQNAGKGRVCATYERTYAITKIKSIVRKVK